MISDFNKMLITAVFQQHPDLKLLKAQSQLIQHYGPAKIYRAQPQAECPIQSSSSAVHVCNSVAASGDT
jgi:hypothetical protein